MKRHQEADDRPRSTSPARAISMGVGSYYGDAAATPAALSAAESATGVARYEPRIRSGLSMARGSIVDRPTASSEPPNADGGINAPGKNDAPPAPADGGQRTPSVTRRRGASVAPAPESPRSSLGPEPGPELESATAKRVRLRPMAKGSMVGRLPTSDDKFSDEELAASLSASDRDLKMASVATGQQRRVALVPAPEGHPKGDGTGSPQPSDHLNSSLTGGSFPVAAGALDDAASDSIDRNTGQTFRRLGQERSPSSPEEEKVEEHSPSSLDGQSTAHAGISLASNLAQPPVPRPERHESASNLGDVEPEAEVLVDAVVVGAPFEDDQNLPAAVATPIKAEKTILGMSLRWAYTCGGILLLLFCVTVLVVFLTALGDDDSQAAGKRTTPQELVPTVCPSVMPTFEIPTETPTLSPTGLPTGQPSSIPTQSPTGSPTVGPTQTASPTAGPTEVPTRLPSVIPTLAPTGSPTVSHAPTVTGMPTGLPSVGPPTIFYVMSGQYKAEELRNLPAHLSSLPASNEEFLVHLGDWNAHMSKYCQQDNYTTFANLMRSSSVPVYLVPGDNDYDECPDPKVALARWHQFLGAYDQKYWPAPSGYTVKRQSNRTENFAFLHRKVLFIGLGVFSGNKHDPDEWNSRIEDNLEWVDANFDEHKGEAEAMFLFANEPFSIHLPVKDFYFPLGNRTRDVYKIPTFVAFTSTGTFMGNVEDKVQKDYMKGVTNFVGVHVDKYVWPPMRIEVDFESSPHKFSVDQYSWYNELYNNSITRFYVFGGQFVAENFTELPINSLPDFDGEFIVHLGDWQDKYPIDCNGSHYADFASLLMNSSVPVYLVPGEHEYNNCPSPKLAWTNWEQYLGSYDQQHWPAPSQYTVTRQTGRQENFAFLYRQVLFIGLNLVGGQKHDANEWKTRLKDNLEWVDFNVEKYDGEAEVIVLFGNIDSYFGRANKDFFRPLKNRIKKEYKMPILLVHCYITKRFEGKENWDGIRDKIELDVQNTPGYMNVHVEKGVWPPMRIEINAEVKVYYADAYYWYRNIGSGDQD